MRLKRDTCIRNEHLSRRLYPTHARIRLRIFHARSWTASSLPRLPRHFTKLYTLGSICLSNQLAYALESKTDELPPVSRSSRRKHVKQQRLVRAHRDLQGCAGQVTTPTTLEARTTLCCSVSTLENSHKVGDCRVLSRCVWGSMGKF